jgi:hypothetical protein
MADVQAGHLKNILELIMEELEKPQAIKIDTQMAREV